MMQLATVNAARRAVAPQIGSKTQLGDSRAVDLKPSVPTVVVALKPSAAAALSCCPDDPAAMTTGVIFAPR